MFNYFNKKIYSLITFCFFVNISLFYLYNKEIYYSIFLEQTFDWYQIMSKNILLSCNGYYCESPLIPFVANIFNLYTDSVIYNAFNVSLIFILLNINIYLINKYYNFFVALILLLYLLLTIHFKQMFIWVNFPDIELILMSTLAFIMLENNYRDHKKIIAYVIICLPLLHFTLSIFIVCGAVLLLNIYNNNYYKSIFFINNFLIGSLILILFLLFSKEASSSFIDQNRLGTLLFNFISIVSRSGLFKVNLLFETIPIFALLVFIISYILRYQIFILLTMLLIFGLLLQFVATDEVRIFRTFFIPVSFYGFLLLIHNDNFIPKFKKNLLLLLNKSRSII
jgi:hypothetical protein